MAEFGSGFDRGFGFFGRGFLQLVVGPHPTYEDQDILGACNWRRARHMHAEGISCQGPGGYVGGSQPLWEIWLAKVHQYRFERVSLTEMKRTNLWTLEQEILSNVPNAKGEAIHLKEYIARRVGSGKMPLFGTEGAERWYGGRTDATHERLDEVWLEIEARTPKRETDYAGSPFGDHRKYLVISVDDFDDETGGQLVEPLVDESDPENPVAAKKRKRHVAWRNLRDVVEADVLDKQKEVRIEMVRKHVRSEIVLAKVLS